MPDGSRCQVVRYPATLDGQISFTVRKHSTVSFSLQELKEYGAFDNWEDKSFNKSWLDTTAHLTERDKELLDLKASGDIIGFLSKCVQYHKNIVIAGKTGSGKTTFAKAPYTGHIISVGEDITIQKTPTGKLIIHETENLPGIKEQDTSNRLKIVYGANGKGDIASKANDLEIGKQKELDNSLDGKGKA